MSTVAYEIVDVFTDRPFAGNPLAVVFGAEDLATSQMQALAREFNLSETVFLLPVTTSRATYRVRIFTPETELPFAGHPSVGAAVTAMRRGAFTAGDVIQECGAGLLPVTVTASGTATLTGASPTLGAPMDPTPLLAATGLTAADYAGDEAAVPRTASCGLAWTYLPVRPEALPRIQIDQRAMAALNLTDISIFTWSPPTPAAFPLPGSPAASPASGSPGAAPVPVSSADLGSPVGHASLGKPTRFTAADGEAHARVFIAGGSVPEDPATGSAALGLGVWLVSAGWLPADGTSSYRIHQGVAMKRPSRLNCTVTAAAGKAVSATVTGQVWPVAEGRITVPPFIG
ncbi:PhzF family phenazine biosynthesis protein [Actinoplanes derwentensis]|uniref:Trans-2,3-dihydro-3-hydroxyanthranilate isomerase n=1 Tax=Actinoplanes derwentensis TaxID=113562 RepID=A0A1H2D073_9ACTN|nr:PhzF family phenazine biosynthesis protein [Actinoplanes derwentensis]GID85898.1 hypothetical protein Ade03nite_48220 [Actinoplanes derwentensis]SDT76121.1 trans-2,3-dihydro-3-hydroxyanthranilate isomerase [Actinoplanes derwentensis]